MKFLKKSAPQKGPTSIVFEPAGRTVRFSKEPCVLDIALKNKIDIDHSCGGSGSCGTCRIRILKGLEKLDPRNDVEEAMAKDRGFSEDERLACQIEPRDGLIIEVPESED